jgi:hypothetical protein
MKLFKLIFLVAAMLLASCAALKPGCIIEDKVTALAADALVKGLECENAFAVHQDVKAGIDSLGLCKTGPIADVVCPHVSSAVVEKLALVVPAEWKCKAVNAKEKAKQLFTSACKLIPVSQWKPPQA